MLIIFGNFIKCIFQNMYRIVSLKSVMILGQTMGSEVSMNDTAAESFNWGRLKCL